MLRSLAASQPSLKQSTLWHKNLSKANFAKICIVQNSTISHDGKGSLKGNGSIAIRRETKNRWEGRAAIAPKHVEQLVQKGVKVLVQPSKLRAFSDLEYKRAGATLSEDISDASVIVGVKEVPVKELIPNRTYLFFSHTHKAQPYNMPMLDAILKNNIRLIDYERMVDDQGIRLVKFGHFAGLAGMVDFAHGIGKRLLGLGYHNPFLHIAQTYSYGALKACQEAFTRLGDEIRSVGLHKDVGPFIVAFIGDGAVSSGAQHMLKHSKPVYFEPNEIDRIIQSGDTSQIYATVINPKDYLVRADGKDFNMADYVQNPEKYRSVFHEKFGPHVSAIVNGIYWESKYPRIFTTAQLKALSDRKSLRLIGIADISADPNGSIEFMTKCTTIDDPFLVYDVESDKNHQDMEGKGIMILSVDNLPAELPKEATEYFGDSLLPFIEPLAWQDGSKAPETQSDLLSPLKRAVIASHGKLTKDYSYIDDLRSMHRKQLKNILLLGSGMVAGPLVDYLRRFKENHITIATAAEHEGVQLASKHSQVTVSPLNVKDAASLQKLVSAHDIVVSLVPATFHALVAEACIKEKKNMVTASYISPQLRQMDSAAKDAGIVILNEIGLDPGIDHLSAMKIIHEAQAQGSEVAQFVSWCGGLPAPEDSNNPLGYKFSWSPRGVLTAGLNAAKYKKKDQILEIPSGQLFFNAQPVHIYPGYALEGLANRDSLSYAPAYGIESVHTMFRGTLRFQGFSSNMASLNAVGLFDMSPNDALKPGSKDRSWLEVMQSLAPSGTKDLEQYFASVISKSHPSMTPDKVLKGINAMKWLGLFSEQKAELRGSLLDTLCALLEKKLAYQPGERDLVILHHDIVIQHKGKKAKENRTSTLIAYGEPNGYTAMAKTVGLPAAIATQMVLNGHITKKGVIAPLVPEIYNPILHDLEKEGIICVEASNEVL